ncbi:MAG: PD40 domain-containing protein [Anaerolineae bacterium]|nr:PD40 domain-containing protein [Anaerolineae bacterium]
MGRYIRTFVLAEISPSWSPDGQYIVFNHEVACTSQIVLVRADGSQWKELTPLGVPNDNKAPDWRIIR